MILALPTSASSRLHDSLCFRLRRLLIVSASAVRHFMLCKSHGKKKILSKSGVDGPPLPSRPPGPAWVDTGTRNCRPMMGPQVSHFCCFFNAEAPHFLNVTPQQTKREIKHARAHAWVDTCVRTCRPMMDPGPGMGRHVHTNLSTHDGDRVRYASTPRGRQI